MTGVVLLIAEEADEITVGVGLVGRELHALPSAKPDGKPRHPVEADGLAEWPGVAAQVDAAPQLGLARGAAP